MIIGPREIKDLVCVDPKGFEEFLTMGGIYQGRPTALNSFEIRGDNGMITICAGSRFEAMK